MSLQHASSRRRVWALVLLFVLALAVRGFRAWQEPVVNPDAVRFIDQARQLATDPIGAMRGEPYHPLHSAAGLLAHDVTRLLMADDRAAWLAALQLVGVIAGAFVALQIVWLARAFGARFYWAIAAAAVWMVGRRTSAYGADGLSDMLFLTLFAGAMLLGIRATQFRARRATPKQLASFFAAGCLAGLAYLTRPEGLGAAMILVAAVLLLMIGQPPFLRRFKGRRFKLFRRRRINPASGLCAILCLLIGAAIPAVPYMAVIRGVTAKKTLPIAFRNPEQPESRPPSNGQFANPPETAAAIRFVTGPAVGETIHESTIDQVTEACRKVAMELWETFGFAPTLIVLLAIPLNPRFWGRARMRMVVILWAELWTAVMLWLVRGAGYLDGRHTLPLELVLFGLLALAFQAWGKPMVWFMNWFRRRDRWAALPAWRKWPGWPSVASAVVVLLAIMPGAIELQVPPMADRRFIRDTANWVAANTVPDTIVCDKDRLVGYYSGHPYALWLGSAQSPQLDVLAALAQQHPHMLITALYLVDRGEKPQDAIGPYQAVAAFQSQTAAAHDVLVLYARPNDRIFPHGPAPVLSTLPAAMLRPSATGP